MDTVTDAMGMGMTQAPAPQAQSDRLNAFVQALMQRSMQPRMPGAPGQGAPGPQGGPPQAQQGPQYGQQGVVQGRSGPGAGQAEQFEMGQKVANSIMMGVQNAVQQHKQKQLNEATAMWQTLQAAHERLMLANKVKPDGTVDLMQDPMAAAILTDPKRMKNMAKAFQVDMLNPEKTNVYAEGLKKAMALDKSGKMVKMLRALKMQKQVQPQMDQAQRGQMGQELGNRVSGMASGGGMNPAQMEGLMRIAETKDYHDQTLEERRIQHADSLQMRIAELATRQDQFKQMMNFRDISLNDLQDYRHQMEALRKEDIQLRAELAMTMNDIPNLKEAVERGLPINMIDAKTRDKVVEAFQKANERVPTPFGPAEQQTLDDSLNQIAKIGAWKTQLESMKGPDGQLPNKPLGMSGMLLDRLKYWSGQNSPEAALISDLSRERWGALAGLVKGVRRGDILRDMTTHTPDTTKDSLALMFTKLDALEANYQIARATALKEHGYTKDPVTGNDLDADIKSYDAHLKAADADIAKQKVSKFDKFKVKVKTNAPAGQ